MCVLPLISPHTYILLEQKKFIHKVEVDHLVNLVYADIVERMYKNKIPLNDVLTGREFPIDETYLQELKYDKKLPYKGSYRFKEAKHKGKEPYTLYLLELDFKFVPIEKKEVKEDEEVPGTLKYHYDLFVKHDLGVGELPAEEGEKEEEEDEQPEEEE